jgi:hypothetical protein
MEGRRHHGPNGLDPLLVTAISGAILELYVPSFTHDNPTSPSKLHRASLGVLRRTSGCVKLWLVRPCPFASVTLLPIVFSVSRFACFANLIPHSLQRISNDILAIGSLAEGMHEPSKGTIDLA